MISLKIKKTNININQKIYDRCIEEVGVHTLKCSCGRHEMVKHGYYKRKVKTAVGVVIIKILRVKCKACNTTHAILLALIVPYQRIQLNIQIKILDKSVDDETIMINNSTISEQDMHRVRKRYKAHYEGWMKTTHLTFKSDLVTAAYESFKSNFMQIKNKKRYILV